MRSWLTLVELLMQEYDGGGRMAVVSSSYVWMCMTGHKGTEVCVADANDLASVLDKFTVSSSHILCIAGVPGTCLLHLMLPVIILEGHSVERIPS